MQKSLLIAILLTILSMSLESDTGPKDIYMLASGIEKEWPELEDLGASGAFWMSKEDMGKTMIQAGYGDEPSATRIAKFWQHAIPSEPSSQWLVTSALLGNDASVENIAFAFEHGRFEDGVTPPELKTLMSRMKIVLARLEEIEKEDDND